MDSNGVLSGLLQKGFRVNWCGTAVLVNVNVLEDWHALHVFFSRVENVMNGLAFHKNHFLHRKNTARCHLYGGGR